MLASASHDRRAAKRRRARASIARQRLRAAGFDVARGAVRVLRVPRAVGDAGRGRRRAGDARGGASSAGRADDAGVALLLLALGGARAGAAARALARDGVLAFPAQRRRGVNLVATRRGRRCARIERSARSGSWRISTRSRSPFPFSRARRALRWSERCGSPAIVGVAQHRRSGSCATSG